MDSPLEKFWMFNQQEYEKNQTILQLFHAVKQAELLSKKYPLALRLRKKLLKALYHFPDIKKEICVHGMLLELAKLCPINQEDFLTLDEINCSDAFYIASGHQFQIQNFIEWLIDYGRMINPFTSVELHILDILHLCREMDRQNLDHETEKKLYAMIFPIFIDYMKNQEIKFIQFSFSYLPPSSATRKALCSFLLCHIAQTTNEKMKLFEIIYNNADLDIDYLHLWGRDPDVSFNKTLSQTSLTVTEQPPKRLINIAALYGNYEIVEFLLKKAPALDLYLVQYQERTVLFDVVYAEKIHQGNAISAYGFEKIAELLLLYRADPLIKIRGISLQNYACLHHIDWIKGDIWTYLEETPGSSDATYQVIHAYIQQHNPSILNCMCNFMWKKTENVMHLLGEQIGWPHLSHPF